MKRYIRKGTKGRGGEGRKEGERKGREVRVGMKSEADVRKIL